MDKILRLSKSETIPTNITADMGFLLEYIGKRSHRIAYNPPEKTPRVYKHPSGNTPLMFSVILEREPSHYSPVAIHNAITAKPLKKRAKSTSKQYKSVNPDTNLLPSRETPSDSHDDAFTLGRKSTTDEKKRESLKTNEIKITGNS